MFAQLLATFATKLTDFKGHLKLHAWAQNELSTKWTSNNWLSKLCNFYASCGVCLKCQKVPPSVGGGTSPSCHKLAMHGYTHQSPSQNSCLCPCYMWFSTGTYACFKNINFVYILNQTVIKKLAFSFFIAWHSLIVSPRFTHKSTPFCSTGPRCLSFQRESLPILSIVHAHSLNEGSHFEFSLVQCKLYSI